MLPNQIGKLPIGTMIKGVVDENVRVQPNKVFPGVLRWAPPVRMIYSPVGKAGQR